MPVPEKFPSDADIARIAKEAEFYQLYKSNPLAEGSDEASKRMKFLLQEYFQDDREKLAILHIALNVAPKIVRAGTRFLFGKDLKIAVADATAGAADIQEKLDALLKRNRIHRRLKESSKAFQYAGHTQFKVWKDEKGAVIEEVPFDQWYPDFRNVRPGAKPERYFIVAYMTAGDGPTPQKYIFVEEHTAQETVYRLFQNRGGKCGDAVPLDTLANLYPASATLDAGGLAAREANPLREVALEQIDAEKDVKDRMGESVLLPIVPLLHEINAKLTQMSLQIFKHLDPVLEVPEGSVPRDRDGKIERRKLDILLTQQGDNPSRYVTNDNPLVEQTFAYIRWALEECARLTDTPADFVAGSEKGGVETAEALKVRFMDFLKRVEEYRSSYTEGLERVLTLALRLEGVKVLEDIEYRFTFDFGLPKDADYDGRVWGAAYKDGIASRKTAVARFQELEGDLLDEELAEIQKDQEEMPQFGIEPGVPGEPTPPQDEA